MKKLVLIIGIILASLSCSTKDEYTYDPYTNYKALWKILDEGYCYFDIKLPADSSWQDMYDKHYAKLNPKMSSDSLFRVLCDLTAELKDGHVNISTVFDFGRYWAWHEDHPSNLSIDLRKEYLGTNYAIAGGLKYKYLEPKNPSKARIGYILCESFSSGPNNGNVDASLSRLRDCEALIVDIRGNGGGNITLAENFARHFMEKPMKTGYIRHKTGPGHQDFSAPLQLNLDTLQYGVRWLRPVVLLSNRQVYSAANDFCMLMKEMPYVTMMGDQSGGGAGIPVSSELPTGWGVRYSSSRMTDFEDKDVEFGIAPHYKVMLSGEDLSNGEDTLIEEAVRYINRKLIEYQNTGVWIK